MKASRKTLAAACGTALAATLACAPAAQAAENPFALKSLGSGYMVAEHHEGEKSMEGKCGAGKCGAEMKDAEAEGKAKEGSCGADKKAKEGSCGAEKDKEGSCGANKK